MKKLRQIAEEYEHYLSERGQKHLTNLDSTLAKHYAKEKYTPDHMKAMQHYTDGSSINYELWDHHEKGFKGTPYHSMRGYTEDNHPMNDRNVVEDLDSAMKHVRAPRSFHVYSNTRIDPRKKMNAAGVLHHPAYMSTSINKEYPKHWYHKNEVQLKAEDVGEKKYLIGHDAVEQHVLKIRVPKGMPGAYVGSHISTVKDQHEFIFPRAQNLKYHSTKSEFVEKGNMTGRSHKIIRTHTMEIVP